MPKLSSDPIIVEQYFDVLTCQSVHYQRCSGALAALSQTFRLVNKVGYSLVLIAPNDRWSRSIAEVFLSPVESFFLSPGICQFRNRQSSSLYPYFQRTQPFDVHSSPLVITCSLKGKFRNQ